MLSITQSGPLIGILYVIPFFAVIGVGLSRSIDLAVVTAGAFA